MRLRNYAMGLAVAVASIPPAQAQKPMILEDDFVERAGTLDLGPVRVAPALRAVAGYDDNIFESSQDEVSSAFYNAVAEVSASLAYDRSALLLGYQADHIAFDESSDDNITDHLFFLRGKTEAGLRHRLQFDLSHVRDHEARGTGLTEGFDFDQLPGSPDRFTDDRARLQYQFGARKAPGQLRLDASWLDRSYENHRERTRFFDRSQAGVGATFLWRVMPRTSLAFEARARDIDYSEQRLGEASRDSRERDLLAGIEWEATAATRGSFRIGEKTKEFDDSGRDDSSNLGWELSAKWAPRTYSVLGLSLERAPQETNANGDFIDSKRYEVSWRHHWLERLYTEVSAARDDRTYQEVERDQEVDSAMLEVGYQQRRWLAWRLAAEWRDRSSEFEPQEFSRNRYWLSVELSL